MNLATPTLLLSRTTIAGLATTKDYLRAMQAAFADLAQQRYALPDVGHVAGVGGAFHIKAARREGGHSLAAIKVNGNFPGNPAMNGLPTIQGFIALLDAGNGSILALMDSIEITARRTAAVTALAASHLARPASRALGVVGCGVQARYHVEALLDVARIEHVMFCDPNDARAAAFEQLARELGISCARVSNARAAARGADILVTLTPATEAIVQLADVEPGAFVAGIGADNPAKHELAPELLRGSRVVVDLLAQARVMGDLHHAIAAAVMTPADIHAELADVVAGRVAGRADERERFVFDSTGFAAEDLAAAEMIYRRALGSDAIASGAIPAITLNDMQ